MKLGIIGTGKITTEFLPGIVRGESFEVTALCSTPRSAEKAAALCAEYGIKNRFTDFYAMLETVDCVYLAVPNSLHYRYARAALEAGRHVIVEKPMAANAAEADALAELARKNRLFLFEAITTLYLENYQKVRELLSCIGTVKLVQCNYSQYSSRYDAFCAGTVLPAFDPACAGGALMDLNLYNLAYVVGLFGAPETAVYRANIERGIDTSGAALLGYPGFQAVCIAAKDCAAPARCVIQGTKGYILQNTAPNVCGAVTLHRNDGTEQTWELSGGRTRQMAEFAVFASRMAAGDHAFCYDRLDTSLALSHTMTALRRSAGIHFPADKEEGPPGGPYGGSLTIK